MARRTEITVLIADHSTLGRQVLEQMLEHLGIPRVLSARSGAEARGLLARHRVDLLIAAMDLPDMGGLDLLAALRAETAGARGTPGADPPAPAVAARSVNPGLRVVLSAADPPPDSLSGARRLDLTSLLLKPYRIENVLHCVELGCGRI